MKTMWTVLLAAALLLCGCQTQKTESPEALEGLQKAQEVTVLAGDGSQIRTLSEKSELSDFIQGLGLSGDWSPATLPEGAAPLGTFLLSQEKTKTLLGPSGDGALREVCRLRCYEGLPYLTLEAGGLKMTFQIPAATAEYLRGFFAKGL